MQRYLTKGEIAKYLGVSLSTIKGYDRRGYLPEPDVQVGRTFGWAPATIDAWLLTRPGAGARTDLHDE